MRWPWQRRPESVVLWLPMFKGGQVGPVGSIRRPIVDYGITSRDDVKRFWNNPDKLLRLEIEPHTLRVISARSEEP